jgi:hypothetical protein
MGRVATTDLAADEAAVPEAVDHVPAAVSDALELLTAPPHPSSASWAVQTAVWADRRIDDDDAAVWVEEELRVIEAVERSRRGPTSRVSLPPDGCGRRCTSRCAPTTTLEHLHQAPVLSPEVVSAESLTATSTRPPWRRACRPGRWPGGWSWPPTPAGEGLVCWPRWPVER